VNRRIAFLTSRWAHIFSGVLFGFIFLIFAGAHLLSFLKSHHVSLLIFALSETLIVFFYVFRSKPLTISVHWYDWLVAFLGTFLPLCYRPSEWGVLPIANVLLMTGAIIQILSVLSLNRSFAIIAANRKIKTAGMYRFVRHPIYASYCLTLLGYVLTNTTLQNGLVYGLSMLFLYLRIISEEKHLSLAPLYRDYKLKVRYKLIPYLL